MRSTNVEIALSSLGIDALISSREPVRRLAKPA
jgi:hypothetical protein